MNKLNILLFAVFLFAGLSSVANGQSSDDETISATANVVQAMKVGTENADLEFNTIVVNSQKRISAADGFVDVFPAPGSGRVDGVTGGEQRGFFSLENSEGADVSLTLQVPENLTNANDAELSIDFSDTGSGSSKLNGLVANISSNPDPEESLFDKIVDGADGDDFTPSGVTEGTEWVLSAFTMPSSTVYLVIGGEVFADVNQEPGFYEGTVTLTALIVD